MLTRHHFLTWKCVWALSLGYHHLSRGCRVVKLYMAHFCARRTSNIVPYSYIAAHPCRICVDFEFPVWEFFNFHDRDKVVPGMGYHNPFHEPRICLRVCSLIRCECSPLPFGYIEGYIRFAIEFSTQFRITIEISSERLTPVTTMPSARLLTFFKSYFAAFHAATCNVLEFIFDDLIALSYRKLFVN